VHRREELEQWISQTRKTQRRLAVFLPLAAITSVGLLAWQTAVGGFALLCVSLVAICSYWITSSHLADWERKLDELDRPPAPRHAGRYER